jgi:hypothetical protein
MSIRAHRVVEIKTHEDSFNLWHDDEIVEWLGKKTSFFHPLSDDSCGLTEVSVGDLKAMLSEIGDKLDDHVKRAIQSDISFAEERGDEYVTYYCY